MKQLLFTTILALSAAIGARAQLVMQGRIEYERKINQHRQYEGEDWFESYKGRVPRFNISYFDLAFNTTRSMYKPGREGPATTKMMFGSAPAGENIVFTDFAAKEVKAGKQIFEQKFLVEDSIRKVPWKITDEVRIVAGYKCRKAVSRICDSVYVVAFYTDDIAVSGGPEMFAGLPGMILEIAVPRLYTTWTATKIELSPPDEKELVPPAKGKKTNQKDLMLSLQGSLKDWGKYAARNIWWCVL